VPEQPSLGADETRARARRGAIVVGFRGIAVRCFGLVGTLALTRLLVPHEMGVIALGLAILGSVGFLTDVGVAAGLVRVRATPDRGLLGAMVAFQLALSLPLALAGGMVGLLAGSDDVRAVGLMLLAVPIVAFRTPGAVLLERDLRYGPLAAVEVSEVLVFNAVAVGGAAIGGGVLAITVALLLRNVAGTVLMLARGPIGLVVPRWSWSKLRPHLAFGAKYQAIGVVALVRDQLLNGGTVAIAGASTLGVWSVAFRLLQIPALLFETLSRVAYPAIVRLLEADEDGTGIAVRGTRLITIVSAFVLVPLAASSPALVPALFGARYADAADALPWACAGLLVSGPVSVLGTGLLLAEDRGRSAILVIVAQAVVWVGVSLALLPPLGVVALGIGWFAGCTTSALATAHFALGSMRAWVRSASPLAGIATMSAAIGALGAQRVEPSAFGAIAGGGCGVVALTALMAVFDRSALHECVRLVKSLPRPTTGYGSDRGGTPSSDNA
jgi:O-antigen/teichoic acid export membrane protein